MEIEWCTYQCDQYNTCDSQELELLTRIHFEIFLFLNCETLAGVRCQVGQTSLTQAGEKALDIRPAAILNCDSPLALMVLAMVFIGGRTEKQTPKRTSYGSRADRIFQNLTDVDTDPHLEHWHLL